VFKESTRPSGDQRKIIRWKTAARKPEKAVERKKLILILWQRGKLAEGRDTIIDRAEGAKLEETSLHGYSEQKGKEIASGGGRSSLGEGPQKLGQDGHRRGQANGK